MANHKSAEKRIRQAAKRTAINRARVSRVRTFVKKVETAIETGDKATAMSALRLAQPELLAWAATHPAGPEHSGPGNWPDRVSLSRAGHLTPGMAASTCLGGICPCS